MSRLTAPVRPAGSLGQAGQPPLQAGDLLLRPWAAADAAALRAAFADPEIQRWHARTIESLHRLELEHAVDNTASCRVALKAGYAYEGTRRSAALHADGWHDMHLHAHLQDRSLTT